MAGLKKIIKENSVHPDTSNVPVYSPEKYREELEQNILTMTDKLNKAETRKEKAQWDIDSFAMGLHMMEDELNGLEE